MTAIIMHNVLFLGEAYFCAVIHDWWSSQRELAQSGQLEFALIPFGQPEKAIHVVVIQKGRAAEISGEVLLVQV